MYPFFTIFDIQIHFFGIFILIAWAVFFACLHIFWQQKNITKSIFEDILPFTISIFLFSRFFYILSQWRNEKFLFNEFFSGQKWLWEFLQTILFTENYNLSLAGGIIGFVIIFLHKTKSQKNMRSRYLDVAMPSFLIASLFAYFGGFLGGQVFWVPSTGFFSMEYNTKYRTIPFDGAVFPLPFFFIIGIILLIVIAFLFRKKTLPNGYLGYVLLGWFSILLFIGEFWSGRSDIFEIYIRLNQFIAIIGFIISLLWLIKISRS